MKVYLGKYVYPVTTYDIASKIIFWDNTKYRKKLNSILKFGLTYNQNSKNKKLSILSKFLDKYNSYQKRKVFIKIDDYDVHDLDYTLSLIIEPALKKLLDDEWLSFKVDNEDLPKELQISDDEYNKILKQCQVIIYMITMGLFHFFSSSFLTIRSTMEAGRILTILYFNVEGATR